MWDAKGWRPSLCINSNSMFINDKMVCDKTDTNYNKAVGIYWGYMSIPIVEGIEHGSASVKQ